MDSSNVLVGFLGISVSMLAGPLVYMNIRYDSKTRRSELKYEKVKVNLKHIINLSDDDFEDKDHDDEDDWGDYDEYFRVRIESLDAATGIPLDKEMMNCPDNCSVSEEYAINLEGKVSFTLNDENLFKKLNNGEKVIIGYRKCIKQLYDKWHKDKNGRSSLVAVAFKGYELESIIKQNKRYPISQ